MDESSETNRPAGTLSDREPVKVPRSQVTVKTTATVVAVIFAAAALAWVVLHSTLALTVTIISALLAMALNHAVELLQRWRLPRSAAVGVVVAGLLALVAGIAFLVVPAAAAQLKEVAERGPELLERMRHTSTFVWLDRHANLEERLSADAGEEGLLNGMGTPVLKAIGGAFTFAAGLVTILFLVIFMLAFGGNVVRGLLAESLPAHRERYERVLAKVYRAIGGYMSGLLFVAGLNTTATSIFLAIIGVPFFIPLGILSGLGSFVPLVGVTLSGLVIALVALATQGPWAAVAAIAYITIYQQFENHAVVPLVYRRTVKVNALVVLLAVVFFAELAGVLGALLAVPLTAVAQIILRELLILRRERLGLPLKGEIAPQLRRSAWFRRRQRTV